MGNNNVIGQQEESKNVDKTMADSDCSPALNKINDKEKADTKDVYMSEVLKPPLISNGGDDKMDSDQIIISSANENFDEKKRGSLQDHASAQDDHVNINLRTKEGDKTQKESETEITTNCTEIVFPVGSTIEDMTSNKYTSSSDEQFEQPVHKSIEESEDNNLGNPRRLFEETFEGLPEDEEESWSQEVSVVVGNVVGEGTVENLEEGETGLSTVYDLSTPSSVQGETISSTESILTDYHHADIKDIVTEDEPRERVNPAYVRPEDEASQDISNNDEKQEMCEMGKRKNCKTTAIDTKIQSDHEVPEEDGKIHMLENHKEHFPSHSAYDALDNGDVVSPFQSALADSSAANGGEFQKHELSIAAAREMSDSVREHHAIERTEREQRVTVDIDVADKNEADNCEGDKKSDRQETMNNSQCDQPQQVLLEEPAIVKFENSETLATCLQLVECSSAAELIFPNVSATTTCLTSESNQEIFTGTVGCASESRQKKVITDGDKASDDQCLLQKPTLGTDAGEETLLLLSAESIDSLSYSSEQHVKAAKVIPMTDIFLMQAKDEAGEETENSPLLSPRKPSEGAFRASNQSARNNKPLHSLMTEDRVGMWSPLKEQEPVPEDSAAVSSSRSKEKKKPKSSLFTICMCCTTSKN